MAVLAVALMLVENALRPPYGRATADDSVAARIADAAGATWREAEIQAGDGVTLRAWYFRPAADPIGSVVVLHGVGDSRRGATGHAGYLLGAGYAVLLPDSRAHGESGGFQVTYGVEERGDLAAWTAWLRDQHPGPIYGIGVSMGGAILLQALPHTDFTAAVAESAFSCFDAIGRYRLTQATGLPDPFTLPVVEAGLYYARVGHGVDLRDACPQRALLEDSRETAVLLVHGTEDTNIPVEHSRRLHALPRNKLDIWEVPGAGHVRVLTHSPEEYPRRVLAFFAAQAP